MKIATLVLTALFAASALAEAGVCKGETPCKACANCRSCKYCNSGKGSCSVKRDEEERQYQARKAAREAKARATPPPRR